jgi:NTP pyrophosphatase (non-canonical NTP hydrolase)
MTAEALRSPFADIPAGLSTLERAVYIVQASKAALGSRFGDRASALKAVQRELEELEQAIGEDQGQAAIESELGDVLFSTASLAAVLGVSAEAALVDCLARQERRFLRLAQQLRDAGLDWHSAQRAELEGAWAKAKASEPASAPMAPSKAFLAAPISGFDLEACKRYYGRVHGVVELVRKHWGFANVYCAALSALSGQAQPDEPAAAMRLLFSEIDACGALVLLWPESFPTSALVEIGYALARGIPVVCLHQEAAPLPFLLAQDSERLRRHSYRDFDDLERFIQSTRFSDVRPQTRGTDRGI